MPVPKLRKGCVSFTAVLRKQKFVLLELQNPGKQDQGETTDAMGIARCRLDAFACFQAGRQQDRWRLSGGGAGGDVLTS